MQLPDHEIADLIKDGRLVVDPYDPDLLQPASLDVRLGRAFRFQGYKTTYVGSLKLSPYKLVLGHTLEILKVPDDLAVRIEGKSTWGRRGLMVHLTAGFIDPGFEGQVTLELMNVSADRIALDPGLVIAQLSFHKLSSPARRPYGSPMLGSHYQGQQGPTPAWL